MRRSVRAAVALGLVGLSGASGGAASALTLASSAITVDTPDGAVSVGFTDNGFKQLFGTKPK